MSTELQRILSDFNDSAICFDEIADCIEKFE